jgi:4-amino-4-deoxy-L-arabinose transferase-like glycosyltransferase
MPRSSHHFTNRGAGETMQDGQVDDGPEAPRARAPWAALLVAILLGVPVLFARGLMPPDEARYADVAVAMQETGEWFVPRLHQKWYAEKPPVFFWAIAGLNRIGAPVSMGPRLVSLLAALGILALLPALARGAGLSEASARRGALVLATLPLFTIYSQLGFIDVLLAFEVALAAACKLTRDRLPAGARDRVAWAIAEGGVTGLALLTKGPVVLLFAAGLRIGAALSRRATAATTAGIAARAGASPARVPGAFDRLDLLALAIGAALGGGWLLAAGRIAGPDYVHRIFFGQIERRIGGSEPKHHQWPGFLVAVVLGGALPWSLLALGARAPWRWRELLRPPPRYAALVGWAVLPVVVIALFPTQQPHYSLPSLAPFALLAGEALAWPIRRGARIAAGAVGVVAALLLLALAILLGRVSGATWADPAVAARIASDRLLAAALAVGGIGLLLAVFWRRRAGATNAPLRALAGVIAFFLPMPIVAWRLDDVLTARSLVESPAVAQARRIVAPTGLRSSIRLRTRLENVEEYDGRALDTLLRADPDLLAVEWRHDLEKRGLLDRVQVVARGWLRGRELCAVRGPLGPDPVR